MKFCNLTIESINCSLYAIKLGTDKLSHGQLQEVPRAFLVPQQPFKQCFGHLSCHAMPFLLNIISTLLLHYSRLRARCQLLLFRRALRSTLRRVERPLCCRLQAGSSGRVHATTNRCVLFTKSVNRSTRTLLRS